MKGLRQYQWLVGVLLVALLLAGCETGHQFVKKTEFKDTDKIVLTFAGPVDETWASNVGNFSAYEKPDPDIVLPIKETILSPEKTKLTLVFLNVKKHKRRRLRNDGDAGLGGNRDYLHE